MGYRGNLLTEEIYNEIPENFKAKWRDTYNFSKFGSISSKTELKGHDNFLVELAKHVLKPSWNDEVLFVGVILWEDGYITPFKVYPEKIVHLDRIFTGIHEDNL